MKRIAAFVLATAPLVAFAGVFDDTEDLQGKTIAYAGDFEQVTCPVGGKYDCLQWPSGFFKATKGQEFCFVTDVSNCAYSCRGLIAAGRDRQFSVYVFDAIGSGLRKGSFTSYKCPSLY